MKRVLLVIVAGVCIAACNSNSASPTGPSASTPTSLPGTSSQSLESVTLSVNADVMKARGDTAQTIPIGTFADGTSQNVMATCSNWQTDNVSVLTIDSRGLVTAQGSGTSMIRTTCQVVSSHPIVATSPVFASRLVTLTLGSAGQ